MAPPAVDVSVIIPVFNREALIGRAIRSVLAQTFSDFELIIVDDASTDRTELEVKAFTDSRIRYVRRTVNGGNAAARNTGVKNARGRLIAWLDSDDEYAPEFLEEVRATLGETGDDIGFTWTMRKEKREGAGRRTSVWPTRPPSSGAGRSSYLDLLKRFRGGTGSGLTLKRECFDTVGLFDERLRASVDREFVLRLVQRYGFRKTDKELLYFYHHRGERVSRNDAHQAVAFEVIIERHRDALQENPELWARYHYQAGRFHYRAGNRARGRRMLIESLTRKPLSLRSWLGLLVGEVASASR